MDKITPQILKGMHDRLPEEMRHREKVISIIKDIFEKYGFEPIETPAIEYWEILSGKNRYGEEEKLIYQFKDKKGRDIGLRFDFTVPLARVVAMYPDLPIPFKRYQIQPVWRGEAPQYGRFREFYQCDVDIVGSKSMLADAEILSITSEVFQALGFKEFKIRINNRKILQGLCEYSGIPKEQEFAVFRAIDKQEKIGADGVAEKLEFSGIKQGKERLLDLLQASKTLKDMEVKIQKNAPPILTEGIEELKSLFSYLKEFALPSNLFEFDPWLARGLDYYTGPIYETVVTKPKIGSLAGGGRFDNLIGIFRKETLPATGITIGLERIMIALKELGMLTKNQPTTKVLVTQFYEQRSPEEASSISDSTWIKIAKTLRKLGVNTEIYPDPVKLDKQFKYADKKAIPYVIVVGPDEISAQKITVKNMATHSQQSIPLKDLAKWAKQISVNH